jgi:quinol monooxygenase YgiN
MIMVQSTFQLDSDSKDEVIKLMKKMVRLCRQEHGCLSYEYYEGVTDPFQIILLQEWENADCLQEHYQTDHMADFVSDLENYLDSPISTRSYVSQEEKETAVTTHSSEDLPKPEQTIH